MSKKVKGSNSRQRQRVRVARAHEQISNLRHNHLHQISSRIIRENQTTCVESLAVKNMMKNHCLSKSIADVSWGELLRQLEYKSEWNERTFVKIGRFFPSSKMCNKCKYINDNLSLKDRTWICYGCNTELDRDINAAINILHQGLNISGCGVQSEPKQKRVEASLSKCESMNHENSIGLVHKDLL